RRRGLARREGVEALDGRAEVGDGVRRREVDGEGVDAESGEVVAAGVDGEGVERGGGRTVHRAWKSEKAGRRAPRGVSDLAAAPPPRPPPRCPSARSSSPSCCR